MPLRTRLHVGVLAAVLVTSHGAAQQMSSPEVKTNSSHIEDDGTAYVTRVVPVPTTISPESQKMLAHVQSDAVVHQSLEQRRAGTDRWQMGAGEESKKLYPVTVGSDTIAGVPVRVVSPAYYRAGES